MTYFLRSRVYIFVTHPNPPMQRSVLLTAGICFFIFMFLVSCTPGSGGYSDSSSSSSVMTSSSPSPRPRAAEGEFCGGIAGILCEDGLECEYEGTYPDAGGTCVEN